MILLACSPVKSKPKLTHEEKLIAAEKGVIWEVVAKRQIDVLRRSVADEYLDV